GRCKGGPVAAAVPAAGGIRAAEDGRRYGGDKFQGRPPLRACACLRRFRILSRNPSPGVVSGHVGTPRSRESPMKNVKRTLAGAGMGVAWCAGTGQADWPQWRGPGGTARVANFTPPANWPRELKKQWSVTVGEGVATPALVGDKLYVFSRQDGQEVTRCL